MFFVVSSGRSGSTSAANSFSRFPHCNCLHHPDPELVEEATAYYYGEFDEQTLVDILRSTRVESADGEVYGEANLQLSLMIPLLNRLYPSSQFIWLIRDGRDVVASMYYRGWYDPSVTRVPAQWHRARLRGDRTGDFSEEEWNQLSRFQRCCWLWTKYNRIIESELRQLGGDRFRQVRLEHFKSQMPDLAQFLGLKQPRRVVVEQDNVAFQPVVQWESWSDEHHADFVEQCGRGMDEWYPGWRDSDGNWRIIDREKPDVPGFMRRASQHLKYLANRGVRRIQNWSGDSTSKSQ